MDENIGFDVQETSTGEDAINIIDSKVPDIILLDNKLPGYPELKSSNTSTISGSTP
jgi:DNA-binding response OmpR family regulator